MDLLRFVPGYEHNVYQAGKEPLLLLLLSFLITFTLTRAYTRIARVRGWGSAHVGDVHMHHVVPGVLLIIAAGLVEFAVTPDTVYSELLAIMFGAGAALTLDEFAMVLRLDDVYWSPEGRESIDAIIILTVVILFAFTATAPFGATPNDTAGAIWTTIAINAGLSVITLAKGKLKLAIVSIVFAPLAIIGAVRLAKPGSWWARRFYTPERGRRAAKKLARAQARASVRLMRYDALRLRFYDLIGGAPSRPSPNEPSER